MENELTLKKNRFEEFGLGGSTIKLIALILMTVDHAGMILFNDNYVMRSIGRLAFPLFAYMIAEGCKYTKNRPSYLIKMAIVGIFCGIVFAVTEEFLYINIMFTFLLSASIIFTLEWALKEPDKFWRYLAPAALILLTFSFDILATKFTWFDAGYGFAGAMLPVFVYFGRTKGEKLVLMLIGTVFVSVAIGAFQWYCMFSVIIMAFYNGKRGKLRINKYFFYIYYPVHIGVLYAIYVLYIYFKYNIWLLW